MAESASAKQGEEVGHILILTRNGVVGELIRAHLSAEGFCTTIVPAPFALADGQKYRRAIALCDCDSLYAVNFREYAEKIITWADSQGFRTLFFAVDGDDLIHEALDLGAWGALALGDGVERLTGAARAISGGELYFPRKIIASKIMESPRRKTAEAGCASALSHREREILAALGNWGSNEEISLKLNISAHTVKTHLYRIYRKISVKNRSGALIWAMQNMPDQMGGNTTTPSR